MSSAAAMIGALRVNTELRLFYLICSGEPPEVAFVIAHAASFLVLKSARPKISISTGKIFASITAWNIHNTKAMNRLMG